MLSYDAEVVELVLDEVFGEGEMHGPSELVAMDLLKKSNYLPSSVHQQQDSGYRLFRPIPVSTSLLQCP